MRTEDVLKKLKPWRERNARPAWRPVTANNDGSRTASKFSGLPWLSPSEGWPECKECRKPMPLFLQLDLSTIPPEARSQFGDGLLQLFYCTSCDGGWETFSCVSLVRLLSPLVVGQPSGTAVTSNVLPVKLISGWTSFMDYPDPPEHEALGLKYEYDFKTKPVTTRVTSKEPPFSSEPIRDDGLAEAISVAEPGDKLAGWPLWIQGVEYPRCPACHAPMRVLFQLDSNDNLDFMFGDAGTGHITQCPVHKDVVAFGWACS
jgi:uncharacterized protein YwqG